MLKKINCFLVILLIGAISYVIYAYFKSTMTPSISTQVINGKSITIGWIGPLSGETKWLGVDGLKAIQLVIEQYHQSKKPADATINLLVADSPLGSSVVEKVYDEMVQKKKAKLLLIVSSDDTKELANKALQDDVIIINPLNNDRTLANLNPNIFLIAKTTESLSSVIANRMIALHQRKALVLYSTRESFTVTLAKDFEGAYTAAGGEALMRPYSALIVSDFRAILAEGKALHADGYVFMGDSEMGIAMKQAREMGIKEDFYSTNYINSPTAIANAKEALQGVQFFNFTYLDGNQLLAKQFLKQFEDKYHDKPHIEWTVLQAHDAIQIAISAINKALTKEGDVALNLRKALLSVRDYEGVSGNISIKPDGTSEGIYPGIYLFKDGKPERLK